MNWKWHPSDLVLKPWTDEFDPLKEPMEIMRVWAILLGLPIDFWSREALEVISNKIGYFIGVEPN
jgi:hypothetical protein